LRKRLTDLSTAKRQQGGIQYRKTTLRNGLRVVTEHLPSVRSISIGVWVDVGSRHERPADAGMSHFIEHLVFKGTKKRTAAQIASSLESIGGSLNAFTSREQTCFTARILDEQLPVAIDVLADITCNATFTPANMNREKLVICEEIKESLDNPSDRVHDLFAEAFWGTHALGQPIMGSQESVTHMTRSRLKSFIDDHYRSGSVVVAASGSVSHERLVRMVREKFRFHDGRGEVAPPAMRSNPKAVSVTQEDISQTQFCLGFPGLAYSDHRKMVIMLLSAYLGGGMSSVLFQKIREQRGLAYAVYSYHDFYRDGGVFGCYLGTDAAHVREACDIILKETGRVKRTRLSSRVLDQVKAQIKGHLTLGMESTSSRMSRLGRLEIMADTYISLEETLAAVDRVTAAKILEVANEAFDPSKITIAVLGPVDPGLFDHLR
jgi:predicted Zn-dependent peptidase